MKNWVRKSLGEVCEMYQPKTISTKEMVEYGSYSVFGANGIIGKYDKYNHEEPQLLITCRGATCGSVNISEPKSWINGNAMVVRPKGHSIDLKFLEYLFRGGIDLSKTITGAAQPQITRQNLSPILINFPKSLSEQQHIVSILDEAFTAIDKALANAQQNLKNAKELFESYLQAVFENGDWDFVKLSEMTTEISDGDHMPPPKSEFGLPFITISNINKQTHRIDFSDTFKVPQQYYNNLKSNKKPSKGDVLYTVTGSYGIPVLIEDDFQFCFQRHIGLIRPSNKLNSRLLYYWILSPQAFLQANETATGTAQKTVSLKALRNFRFPDIPIKQQQTIVRQLDALREETQKLERIYQQKIADLEELKKSILQKAFAGELKTEKSRRDDMIIKKDDHTQKQNPERVI
jgi:type I restriction enzyme S subunit